MRQNWPRAFWEMLLDGLIILRINLPLLHREIKEHQEILHLAPEVHVVSWQGTEHWHIRQGACSPKSTVPNEDGRVDTNGFPGFSATRKRQHSKASTITRSNFSVFKEFMISFLLSNWLHWNPSCLKIFKRCSNVIPLLSRSGQIFCSCGCCFPPLFLSSLIPSHLYASS